MKMIKMQFLRKTLFQLVVVVTGLTLFLLSHFPQAQAKSSIKCQEELVSITLNPSEVVGGNKTRGMVRLKACRPNKLVVPGTVNISSSNTAVANPQIPIRSGSTVTFDLETFPVPTPTLVNIGVSYQKHRTFRSVPDRILNTTVKVMPPTLISLTCNPENVTGGKPSTCHLTLNGSVPSNGVRISISSSNSAVVTAPTSVKISSGNRVSFTANTKGVGGQTIVSLSASQGRTTTKTATLKVSPASIFGMTLTPSRITLPPPPEGSSVNVLAGLNGEAPPGGAIIRIRDDGPLATSINNSNSVINIHQGRSKGNLTFTVFPCGPNQASCKDIISATYKGVTKTATLEVAMSSASSSNPSQKGVPLILDGLKAKNFLKKNKSKLCSAAWLPEGSRPKVQPDGSILIHLPPGYRVLPFDDVPPSRFRAGNSLGLTCNCTKGSGDCTPTVVTKGPGKGRYCIMGSNCGQCSNPDFGLITLGNDIRFATSREIGKLPSGNPVELYRVKEIQGRLAKFIKAKNLGGMPSARAKGKWFIAPKGFVFTPINVFGYGAYVIVSAQYAKANRLSTAVKFTCNCSSGSSGCIKEKQYILYACKAGNCSSCTLIDGKISGLKPKFFPK